MRLRTVTFALVALLAFAPQAFAWGGGGKSKGGAASASFSGAGAFSGSSATLNAGGQASAGSVTTPEPLAALLVGLGLLGARFLRRK